MMSVLRRIWECWETLSGLFRYGIRFSRMLFLKRADSAAKIVALESQLDVSLRSSNSKKKIPFFKLVPVVMVDFRRMLGWLGESVSFNGTQDGSWLVAAWF